MPTRREMMMLQPSTTSLEHSATACHSTMPPSTPASPPTTNSKLNDDACTSASPSTSLSCNSGNCNVTLDDVYSLLEKLQEQKVQDKASRRVCFDPVLSYDDDCTKSTSGCHSLSFEERQCLWYSAPELLEFKVDVRREFFGALPEGTVELAITNDSTTRGLEGYTAQRQYYKRMVRKCTLSGWARFYHGTISHDKFISFVQHFTEWNKKIALLQGCRDQCDAYRPSVLNRMLQIADIIPPELPFAKTKDCGTTASSSSTMPITTTAFERRCANVTPPPEENENVHKLTQQQQLAIGDKRLNSRRSCPLEEEQQQRCIRRRMS